MSESKHNPQALLAATMPALLPTGFVCQGFSIGAQLRPAPNVRLLPRELIRRNENGEIVEVFCERQEPRPDGADLDWEGKMIEAWGPHPADLVIHTLGEPIDPKLCVVVLMVQSHVVDTLDKGIVTLDGRPRQQMQSVVGNKVIAMIPLDVFQKEHLGNLRGPTD